MFSSTHSVSLNCTKMKETFGHGSGTLTSYRQAKEKFHYPTTGLFSESLIMKIKIFFLLEIVRNDVKKHKMKLFPFRFHLT